MHYSYCWSHLLRLSESPVLIGRSFRAVVPGKWKLDCDWTVSERNVTCFRPLRLVSAHFYKDFRRGDTLSPAVLFPRANLELWMVVNAISPIEFLVEVTFWQFSLFAPLLEAREPFYAFSLSVTTVILSLYEFPEVQKRIRSSSASSGCLSRRRPFVVKIDSHGTKTSSTTVK